MNSAAAVVRASLRTVLITAAVLSAVDNPLQAQGAAQSTTVEFLTGGASREGYASARVGLRYQFYNCGGTLELHLRTVSGGVSASSTYWAAGKSGQPAEAAAPARFPAFNAPAQVLSGSRVIAQSRVFGPSADVSMGCLTGYKVSIGAMSSFLPAGATEAQRNQFLASLRLEIVGPADRTLISDGSRIAMERAAREAARSAQQAEAQRVAQARTDSLARARAAAPPPSAPTAAQTATPTTAPSTGTAGVSTTSTQAARENAAADSAARVQRVLAAVEAQRLAEAREQQMIQETAEVAGAAIGGIITAIADSREASAERRRLAEAAAERRRAAALVAYESRAVHRLCDYAKDGKSLPANGNINGSITGSECEGADRGNRHVYRVELRAKESIVVDFFESDIESFVVAVSQLGPDGPVGLKSSYGADLEFRAPRAGTYYLAIGNFHPGFTGSYRIKARALVSTSEGWYVSVGGVMGGGDIGTSGYALPFEFDGRVGRSLTEQVTAYLDFQGTSGIPGVGLGVRYLSRDQSARLRPWVEGSYGSRVISLERDSYSLIAQYKGSGYSLGAGFAYYFWAIGGIDLGLHYSGGTVAEDGVEHTLGGVRAVMGFSAYNIWRR